MGKPSVVHSIIVSTEQRTCCDNPMHVKYVTRCSCGWNSDPDDIYREDVINAINMHKIDVLLADVGIKFNMEWK